MSAANSAVLNGLGATSSGPDGTFGWTHNAGTGVSGPPTANWGDLALGWAQYALCEKPTMATGGQPSKLMKFFPFLAIRLLFFSIF